LWAENLRQFFFGNNLVRVYNFCLQICEIESLYIAR
jgi:hypothetical protein